MNKHRDAHPSPADLFLLLEGEMDARTSAKLKDHLAECWDCRVRHEELQRGIHHFITYRRDVLIPDIVPPLSNIHALRRHFPASQASLFRAVGPGRWPHWIPLSSGISAVVILALLTTYVLRPPQLTASGFFRNVSQANSQPVPHRKVKAQRVEIRQGSRSMEREIVHGRGGPARQTDPQWNALLASLPVDSSDPLNPATFQKWHENQASPRNQILENGGMITLTAEVPALKASLIVRSTDWHAIAEQFEIPGQPPVEIRELALEWRNESLPVTKNVAPREAAPLALPEAPAAVPVITPPDLELREVEVRALLRQTGADRLEVPRIYRENGRLHVEALTETSARRNELAAVLDSQANVEVHLLDAASLAPSPSNKAPQVVPPAYRTDPPLARALWEHMGGMNIANTYLDTLRGEWVRTLSAANALQRLAERYPDGEVLSPAVHARLSELTAESMGGLSGLLDSYLRRLDAPLDAMMQREGVTAALESDSHSCPAWQATAHDVPRDLESVQQAVRRLFLIDYAESALSLSANPLLSDAAQARARLRQQLRCLRHP